MIGKSLLLLIPCVLLLADHHLAIAQAIPLPREENTSLLIDELPPEVTGSYGVEVATPNLGSSFINNIVPFPDGSGRYIVTSQYGPIFWISSLDSPDLNEFIRLSDETCVDAEQGLLGFAFDPDYNTTGEFYVFYNKKTSACKNPAAPSVVSRFTNSDPGGAAVDPNSEEVLLTLDQPHKFHQAGDLKFGPDGYLYVSFGDGGGTAKREESQNTENLFGTICRIDVNGTPDDGLEYRIPPDNPFYNGGPAGSSTRKEIYAYGFRNPFRMSFDEINGHLFACDVGEDSFEEINIIRPGENYGWGCCEGFSCHEFAFCDDQSFTDPISGFAHTSGANAVTGGFVYYGSEFPELYGMYLYADSYRGDIYGLRYDGSSVVEELHLATVSQSNIIATFFQTHDNEVYIGNLKFSGSNPGYAGYKLKSLDPNPDPSTFPTKLSDMPSLWLAGAGRGDEVPGVFPYKPASTLWSDGSLKDRFIALPGLTQIELTNEGGWDFPDESVLIKNFSLTLDEMNPSASTQRIETRLMIKNEGQWYGYSYEWNEDETDATLLSGSKERDFTINKADGTVDHYSWYYPSRTDCMSCHTPAKNFVLGLSTAQMNSMFDYEETGMIANQIQTLDYISIFTEPVGDIASLPKMPDYTNPLYSSNDRARAYLDANCSMCHMPGAPAPVNIDLRYETADEETNLFDTAPGNDLGIPGAGIVVPGSIDKSVLYHRIASDDPTRRMPPLATSRVDEEAVAMIELWIENLNQSAAPEKIWEQYH